MNAQLQLIDQPYGNNLETMECAISQIIGRYFTDNDGILWCAINGATNRPYTDTDPDLQTPPLHECWQANGSFPYALKKTFINYEDSDMVMGELLMAWIARAQVNPSPANTEALERLADLMLAIPEEIGGKNPYGFGFLPKLHGGRRYLHECFEFSADQCLKWMVALDTYGRLTLQPEQRLRAEAILLATARWLDARDFVTPYMGNPNYARLSRLRHYHACFAYLCALGHHLGGEAHLLEEAHFFRDRMLRASDDSGSANSLNLVLEALARLIILMPECADDWKSLMTRNWEARKRYYRDDGTSVYSGFQWNEGLRMATNWLLLRRIGLEPANGINLRDFLSRHNSKSAYYHLVREQDLSRGRADYATYRNLVLGYAYASWLRVYWEAKADGIL